MLAVVEADRDELAWAADRRANASRLGNYRHLLEVNRPDRAQLVRREPIGRDVGNQKGQVAFVVGTEARRVKPENALSHIAGYCLGNDVSERDWQANRSGQWVKGKSFDTFGPLGPWLVTADEIPDPQAIPLTLAVNGAVRQKSNTSDMIFTVAELLSHLSQFMTLLPGDVVVTGTPEGVGAARKPPQFLKQGDVVELDGGILGSQRQRIV